PFYSLAVRERLHELAHAAAGVRGPFELGNMAAARDQLDRGIAEVLAEVVDRTLRQEPIVLAPEDQLGRADAQKPRPAQLDLAQAGAALAHHPLDHRPAPQPGVIARDQPEEQRRPVEEPPGHRERALVEIVER